MANFKLTINGKAVDAQDVDPATPLLWVLRDTLKMKGTKFGCGIAQCGACTVHVDGAPVRSCSYPIGAVEQQQVSTIEGLGEVDNLHPLQQAWIDHDVPQCGYCQAGQLMSAAALLRENPTPSDQDIDEAMAGNICRCATYNRIKAAIKTAAAAPTQKEG